MSPPEASNIAILLGPFIREVPGNAVPRSPALLECVAAGWPAQTVALSDCAGSCVLG